MKRQEQQQSLWEGWREAQKDEQRFHIHYSAAGLGLLMTLQTVGGEAAGAPRWLWLAAIGAFALCLLLSGWSYWWNARYQYAFLMDYARDGNFREHPGWEAFLRLVDALVRLAFFAGVAASAAFFICQRA